jgi:hypothetical protein
MSDLLRIPWIHHDPSSIPQWYHADWLAVQDFLAFLCCIGLCTSARQSWQLAGDNLFGVKWTVETGKDSDMWLQKIESLACQFWMSMSSNVISQTSRQHDCYSCMQYHAKAPWWWHMHTAWITMTITTSPNILHTRVKKFLWCYVFL